MPSNRGAGEESPPDCEEIKSVNSKGNYEYALEGLMLKFQYFDTSCEESTHWK